MRTTIALLLLSTASGVAQSAPSRFGREPDPFESRAWHIQLAGHGALETWNYNVSHEEMWGLVPGFTYGVGKGVALAVTYPLYYVAQRGVDAWLIGGTVGARGRIYRRPRVTFYWEFDVGVSKADTFTPPRGTRFNYLALGGGGATVRIRSRTHVMASMRWAHVSNNGLAGRHRNPDIEAVGPQVGVLIRF